jgi:NAD(P)-dependent dehydrogenase (short-subunit alcohol dehydrogenase family)
MKSNPFSLAGKRALVIGADSGIGLACARGLADAGAKLAISGLNAAAGKALADEIAKDSGVEVAYFPVDVRDEAAVRDLVTTAVEWLGGLDIAMNNAGIPGPAGPIQDMDAAEFDNLFAINVRGAFLGMKYEVPHMLAGGGGSIINLASTAAINGLAFVASYAATKHAVAGLTKSVALEVAAKGVRVNAIAPGPVDTGLLHTMRDDRQKKVPGTPGARVPMDRVARPEEMAGAVVWLASDASSYVTGALISLDGGVVAA